MLKTTLSERQDAVLRAVVAAYVGEAAPVGSKTVAHLLSVRLSAASVRNTMAELTALGLIEKPHRSSGRIPTRSGMLAFVDGSEKAALGDYERRSLARGVEGGDAGGVMQSASRLLSERTRQLGFAIAPRIESLVLRHVSLVRMSRGAVLAVLVSDSGVTLRPVIEDGGTENQSELDRMASVLNERLGQLTLGELRSELAREASSLRDGAQTRSRRAARLGCLALSATRLDDPAEWVFPAQALLFEQPEFRDPVRVRDLFAAVEDREALVRLLDRVIVGGEVRVEMGDGLGEPAWKDFALVAAPYALGDGQSSGALGVIGVIGPRRMDYPRVMALVDYLSGVVTEKLNA